GRLQTKQWKDKDGQTRYTTEINAQSVQFLGSSSGQTASPSAERMPPAQETTETNEQQTFSEPKFTEDDIPF
ncbi:MAG: single-stranded DNA-binding protein, partial [Bdellovibrio sp.]|nr:single-stranded DNA-binding protein [Bdellovibrio sp.]